MSADPTSTPEDMKKKEPTTQEAMFFFAIVKHTKNKADIDWDAVAQEQGFKNPEVAKVRFGQVKRKLGISSDPSATSPRPATPRKKKDPSAGKVKKSTPRKGSAKKNAKDVKSEEDEAPTPSYVKDEAALDEDHFDESYDSLVGPSDPFEM